MTPRRRSRSASGACAEPEGPGVADVDVAVDGRAADVRRQLGRVARLDGRDCAAQGVVELELHAAAAAPRRSSASPRSIAATTKRQRHPAIRRRQGEAQRPVDLPPRQALLGRLVRSSSSSSSASAGVRNGSGHEERSSQKVDSTCASPGAAGGIAGWRRSPAAPRPPPRSACGHRAGLGERGELRRDALDAPQLEHPPDARGEVEGVEPLQLLLRDPVELAPVELGVARGEAAQREPRRQVASIATSSAPSGGEQTSGPRS